MQLRLRSNLHLCDLTDLHNNGWAKAENMILILPTRPRGPERESDLPKTTWLFRGPAFLKGTYEI